MAGRKTQSVELDRAEFEAFIGRAAYDAFPQFDRAKELEITTTVTVVDGASFRVTRLRITQAVD